MRECPAKSILRGVGSLWSEIEDYAEKMPFWLTGKLAKLVSERKPKPEDLRPRKPAPRD
jgi:hypothetical protein